MVQFTERIVVAGLSQSRSLARALTIALRASKQGARSRFAPSRIVGVWHVGIDFLKYYNGQLNDILRTFQDTLVPNTTRAFSVSLPPGGTPLYKLYRYGPPQGIWFLSRFGLNTGIDFDHYGLKSGMVFKGTTGAYKRICLFNSR